MRVSFKLTILLVIATRTLSVMQPCERNLSVELKDRKYNGVTYKAGEYFVDEAGIERGCVCMKGLCSRKCCPFGEAMDIKVKGCVNHTQPFNPPVWNEFGEVKGFNASKEFQFIIGKQNCTVPNAVRMYMHMYIPMLRLNTDGMLYLPLPDEERSLPFTIYSPDKFCIDTFINDLQPDPDGTVLNALICIPPNIPQNTEESNIVLSSTCMLISCFFILLTVGIYSWLPELRNLHGMILKAYLLSFFVAFLCLATMQILFLEDKQSPLSCVILSFFIYFFLLAAFFWLNVMCYDIWYTFSGKRGQTAASSARSRFLKYCAYALGMPALLTVILAALEFSDVSLSVPYMPRLRRDGCFLRKTGRLLYLYAPLAIICVTNLILITLTAFKIAKIKQQTKQILKSSESSTHDQHKKDKQRLSVYVKLFAVVGFNWILEVVSSFFPEANKFWQFTDAYNALVGLIIFVIFVCNKKTWRMLKNKYRVMRGISMTRTQTTTSTSTHTISSQSRDSIHMNSINQTETIN